jgi:hypothetical protein
LTVDENTNSPMRPVRTKQSRHSLLKLIYSSLQFIHCRGMRR